MIGSHHQICFLVFPPLLSFFLFLATTFIWFLLIRIGGFRYRNLFPIRILESFRTGSLYPPTWFFALFGAIISYWLNLLFWKTDPFDWAVIGLSIASFIPGIFMASFLESLFSLRKSTLILPKQTVVSGKPAENFCALLMDENAFTDWLKKEIPIKSREEDLFDLAIFAKRIVLMFQETPLKTFAIVGSYGCGKSSIINMIEESLRSSERLHSAPRKNLFSTDRIVTCKVQGWGLRKNTVAEHILRSILTELSKSVDCLGLSFVPSAYRDVLSNSGSSWLKSFAAVSSEARDPIEILRRLDNVLACTGKRLVLFLEDLERNITGFTYWKEITSLLDRLKDLDNITFVLAINQKSNTYDILIRICEHIEFVPILRRMEVLDCLKFFRNLCLNRFSDTDTDCRTQEDRDKHLGLKDIVRDDIAAMLGSEANDPISVITEVTDNPRALKSTLRNTWHSWQSLHGEIDFDDLLVAKVIYTVAPEAFAFVNERVSLLRSLDSRRGSNEYSRKRNEETRKKLDTAWQKIQGDWDSELIKELIIFLFPGWIEDDSYGGNVPQGVINSRPNDYWIRLNREELTPDEIPDQIVLHGLEYWKRNHKHVIYQEHNLPEAIFRIEGFAAIFEHFGNSLNGREILNLAGGSLRIDSQGKDKPS